MTTKKQKKQTEKDKLKMGSYKAVFKSEFNGDKINLNLTITRDLQYLLRSFIIEDETTNVTVFNNTILRYKYKSKVFSNLGSQTREMLFPKDLIDNGEINLKLSEIEILERMIENFKLGFKYIIKTILTGNQESEVSFKIK